MIRELKTLLAVVHEGSFAAAGDRIGLTQAAVSAQMQRLEAELGFSLFERSGRSARLNARGQQVLAGGREVIRLYQELGAGPNGAAAGARVTVGAIASVQRSFLPKVLAAFHRQVPTCRTHVVPGLSMNLVDLVDAGEADMALAIRPPHSLHRDLHWTTLAQEPFRLIVPRKVTGNDWAELLATHPFVRYDRASFGGRQVDRFLRATHLQVRECCEVDELEAIVQLVAHGVGVALVPQTAQHARWPAAVRAIDLGERTFHREVGLVHRPRHDLSATAGLLADLLVQPRGSRPKGPQAGF